MRVDRRTFLKRALAAVAVCVASIYVPSRAWEVVPKPIRRRSRIFLDDIDREVSEQISGFARMVAEVEARAFYAIPTVPPGTLWAIKKSSLEGYMP